MKKHASTFLQACAMPIIIEVTTRGLKLEEVAENIKKKLLPEAFEQLADKLYWRVMEEVPRRTGKLASSIVKEVTAEGDWQIRALAPYDIYVQMGTRPHEIRPVRADMLVFRTADRHLVFTPLVHHPGTKPNPYMQRAADGIVTEAPWVIVSALEEIFKQYK
jgi:hypothetical protein